MNLLDDEDEDEDASLGGFDGKLKVNAKYAERFEARKKKQELARLRQIHGDDDDEDEETEDEDADLLTPDMDLQILQTIDTIRNRRPDVYQRDKQWFEDTVDGSGDVDADDAEVEETVSDAAQLGGRTNGKASAQVSAKPKLTLKQQLIEQGATALVSDDDASGDDDSGDDDGDSLGLAARRARISGKLGYDQEQRELRRAFMSTAPPADDADADAAAGVAAGGAEDGLLRKKAATAEEKAMQAEEYSLWLRQQLERKGNIDETVTLRRYMEDQNLDKDEAFLRDYMFNALWKQRGGGDSRGGEADDADPDGADDDGGGSEGEEAFSDREDEFERQFNFRFEEPGATQVMSHPRLADDSVRRQTALARKREAASTRQEQKLEERRRKEAELRRLKNLKKQELLERLKTVQKVSGSALPISEVDLSKDFDPEEWDKRMAEMFNDDYYAQKDDEFAAYHEALDEELPKSTARKQSIETLASQLGDGGAEGQQTAQDVLDQYYALDFEDLIAGELPTRFKYRKVEPTGYGVSDSDLLDLDEKALSERVPMRFIKRPYASWNGAKVKGRAKRMRWEALQAERSRLHAKAPVHPTGKVGGLDKRLGKKRKTASPDGPAPGDAAVSAHDRAEKVPKSARPQGGKKAKGKAAATTSVSPHSSKRITDERALAFSKLKTKAGARKKRG